MDGQPDLSAKLEAASSDTLSAKLWREASVIGGGTLKGVSDSLWDACNHPLPVLTEAGVALAAGYGLARMQGGSSMLKFGAELGGASLTYSFCKDLSGRAGAVFDAACDTWKSDRNTESNKEVVAGALGPFAIDTAATLLPGLAGAKWGANNNIFDSLRTKSWESGRDGVFRVYQDKVGTGSGFPLDKQGLFGTAFHVAEVSPEFTLRNINGAHLTARPIAGLPGPDVALLQADLKSSTSLTPWTMADTLERVQPGKTIKAAAIGVPNGSDLRVETGFLENKATDVKGDLEYQLAEGKVEALRPARMLRGLRALGGMSGGPVVNEQQKVVGVLIAECTNTMSNILGDGGVHTPIDHLTRLMSFLERSRIPGAAVDIPEAARRLQMTPNEVLDGLHKGKLEGFIVPQQSKSVIGETSARWLESHRNEATGVQETSSPGDKDQPLPNWEWRVLVDKPVTAIN